MILRNLIVYSMSCGRSVFLKPWQQIVNKNKDKQNKSHVHSYQGTKNVINMYLARYEISITSFDKYYDRGDTTSYRVIFFRKELLKLKTA